MSLIVIMRRTMRSVVLDFKESMEVKTLHGSHIDISRDSEDSSRTRGFILGCATKLIDGNNQFTTNNEKYLIV